MNQHKLYIIQTPIQHLMNLKDDDRLKQDIKKNVRYLKLPFQPFDKKLLLFPLLG